MVRNFYLFCLFFCGSFCYGDWVLPVFSNEWFLDQPGSISFYIDSCGNKAYAYKNDDTVPEPLAKSALSNPFFEENCKWGGVYQSHQEVMTKPLSFPGTEEDWNTILLSKNPIFPQKYVRSCSDEKGSEKDSISIIAYPVYECPPGSRRSDGQYGCSTTPKVCNADVVGRDMKSDYKIIQSLGHVGLTMTSDDQDILEVLNTERPALHTNTFYSFSHNPSALFWGEVFAPISDIQITNEQASKIVFAGMEQGAYSPEYSYLPLAFPGRLINLYIFNPETLSFLKEPSSVPGFFRCDTFVAYAYKEGAGVNLGSYAFLTPNKIYNEFTQKRDAFPTPISKIFPRLNLPNPTLDSCTTALCYEEELDTLLASEEIDVDNLHAVIQSYIQTTDDPELSNLYLYKQAQKYQDDPSRHDFLIQELGQQKPLALVSNFVEDYQQQAAVKNYDELYAIVRSLQITNEEDIKKLTPAQIESFKKAQALFINILKTSNDVDEVNLALGLADNILPPEEVMELAQEVSERLYLKSSTNLAITNMMINQWFSGGQKVSLQALQKQIPPKVLKFGISARIMNMDIHSLSSKTRDELVSYMEDTRPSCLTLVSIPKSQIKACTHESFNWLDTYSRLLMLSGIPEINFLLTQLIQSKNKMLTANIFLSYRIEEFKAADPKLLQKLKTEFQSFSTEQHSAGENTEVSEALGNLLFLEKSKLSETPS